MMKIMPCFNYCLFMCLPLPSNLNTSTVVTIKILLSSFENQFFCLINFLSFILFYPTLLIHKFLANIVMVQFNSRFWFTTSNSHDDDMPYFLMFLKSYYIICQICVTCSFPPISFLHNLSYNLKFIVLTRSDLNF